MVDCTVKDSIASASTWDNKTNDKIEKAVQLKPETLLLNDKSVAWLDLMYSVVPLTAGKSLNVPVFYPNSFESTELEITIRQTMDEIDMGGKIHPVFVCHTGSPAQVHYVTKEGQLVRIDLPDSDITIQLIESSTP